MEAFVNKQVQKMTEKLDFKQQLLIGEETGEKEEGETDEDAIEVQSDDEENLESNETVIIDEHKSFLSKKSKRNDAILHENIRYRSFLSSKFWNRRTKGRLKKGRQSSLKSNLA